MSGTKNLEHPAVDAATLQAFADAWNRHDIEALMSFMTDTARPGALSKETR